jgi:ribosomal protein S12 methylthiotransferase accessory factor
VNQTTPEHRTAGLACARVLIPGTLPITFGHQNRRLHGLPRLYHVPRRLGRVNRPLEPDDIRQDPHPFS